MHVYALSLGFICFFVFWRFFMFFRNPPRQVPKEENLVTSPADGRICYIKSVGRNEIPASVKGRNSFKLDEYSGFMKELNQEYWLVGIYMSVFDVHYNRAPINGEVEMLHRFAPEKSRSMAVLLINLLLNRRPFDQGADYLLTNERCSSWIVGRDISVGMIQIADKWISDIVPHIRAGQSLRQGEVVGLIRMGSQVDLLLPKTVILDCELGQKVRAGETILASY